jgi:hypothetical protein
MKRDAQTIAGRALSVVMAFRPMVPSQQLELLRPLAVQAAAHALYEGDPDPGIAVEHVLYDAIDAVGLPEGDAMIERNSED